jgi:putative hemolysin
MVRAPPVITPPPTTEAAMATRIEQLEQRLATMASFHIDHIQKARLSHLMGEMNFFIWLV